MRSFILNVPIDFLTMSETIQQIDRAIINHIPIHHAAINVAKLINILKVIDFFSVKYSPELIAGYRNGYFELSRNLKGCGKDMPKQIRFSFTWFLKKFLSMS